MSADIAENVARFHAVTRIERDGGVACIIVDSPPVNALSASVRQGIADAFMDLAGDRLVDAVVILCEGRTFFAGADITELGQTGVGPSLRDIITIIENFERPVVVAIHGSGFGGGLEIALAADYRVGARSARLGLPEVKIGLLPGAGGTQRLPRLIEFDRAAEIIVEGAPITADEALSVGLLDHVCEVGALRDDTVRFARRITAKRRIRDMPPRSGGEDAGRVLANIRERNATRRRGLLAPEAAVKALEAAVTLPIGRGLLAERQLFEELLAGPQSAALRHSFFAERRAAKRTEGMADVAPLPIETVGIVGAGTMGGGIAISFLDAGKNVVLAEKDGAALTARIDAITKHYAQQVDKGRIPVDCGQERLARLETVPDLEGLSTCDLVIEAVFEDLAVKQDVFAKLDRVAKSSAILASNTSYLDIDAIAGTTGRPDMVCGLHFFSPANIMRLVEVVRGRVTRHDVLATAMGLAKSLGKAPVLVGNGYGFVGNRMLAIRRREAESLILEGASPSDVDQAMYDFGFPMGPFAMQDMAGLDIGWNATASRSATVREILCERGRRGQKTGAGYYDYDERRRPSRSPAVEAIIREFASKEGIKRRRVSPDEILERCLLGMVNEGMRILEEGVATRPSDIDVVWINGYGWPAHTGGPMYWADMLGLRNVVDKLHDLDRRHPGRFEAADLMVSLAAGGRKISDFDMVRA